MIFREITLFQRIEVVIGKAIMVWRDCSQVRVVTFIHITVLYNSVCVLRGVDLEELLILFSF